MLLRGRLGLGVLNDLQGILGECHCAVAVGLKVDTDVEAQSGVVEMLDTGVGADDGELQDLFDVICAGAVGVGGLDDTDLQL